MKKLNKCIFLINTISIARSLIISIPFSIFLINKNLTFLFFYVSSLPCICNIPKNNRVF